MLNYIEQLKLHQFIIINKYNIKKFRTYVGNNKKLTLMANYNKTPKKNSSSIISCQKPKYIVSSATLILTRCFVINVQESRDFIRYVSSLSDNSPRLDVFCEN